jgi:hypothetical protein
MKIISHKAFLLQQDAANEWEYATRDALTKSCHGFWISDDEFLWTGTLKQLQKFVKSQHQKGRV